MNEPTTWRLVHDGDLEGALNMARDVAVLEAVAAGQAPPTLRLYGWSPPCLTLGRHQGLEAADLGFCRDHGLTVARRATGGRAVLHHLELTYSVAAPLAAGPLPRPLQEAYATVCSALVAAARSLGVAAELTGGEVNLQLPGPRTTVPCFKAPAGGEVVVAGRKLIGSAMRATGGVLLQHGSILLDWDGPLQAGAMGLADDQNLRPHITTFRSELGRTPPRSEIEDAVIAGFTEALGVGLVHGGLSDAELQRQHELAPEHAIPLP